MPLSVATTLKDVVIAGWPTAGALGFPTIPPLEFTLSPQGSPFVPACPNWLMQGLLLDFSENVTGLTPPVTLMVSLYGTPLAAFGMV